MIKLQNSPIEKINYENKNFLVKRDDLLDENFSGNKARKLYYYLVNDFKNIDTIISHGSNQSNAMYSLSVLAKLKKYNFIYYTDHIPRYLELNPQGNYKYALQNGMQIVLKNKNQIINTTINTKNPNELFISEGGAIKEARVGLEILANEIKEYKKQNNISKLAVFLPSGTGTTALFLKEFLDDEVFTCACVGDEEYLQNQFLQLQKDKSTHPKILNTKKKYHFGKLYKTNYETWQKLKQETNIEFDLLYDPIGWETLLLHYDNILKYSKNILYIHQGGLKGNETMIQRYKYKFK